MDCGSLGNVSGRVEFPEFIRDREKEKARIKSSR
jgi:hypothetical protein